MMAVMDQSIYSLRGFHRIRHHSLAPPIERWRNDYLIPTVLLARSANAFIPSTDA